MCEYNFRTFTIPGFVFCVRSWESKGNPPANNPCFLVNKALLLMMVQKSHLQQTGWMVPKPVVNNGISTISPQLVSLPDFC